MSRFFEIFKNRTQSNGEIRQSGIKNIKTTIESQNAKKRRLSLQLDRIGWGISVPPIMISNTIKSRNSVSRSFTQKMDV